MTILNEIGSLEAWQAVVAGLLILLPGIVMYGQIRYSGLSSSDQKFHFLLVDQIRRNRNRFVRKHDFFLINPGIIYPQMLHWSLSFLGERAGVLAGRYISVPVTILSTISLACFTTMIHPGLEQYGIDYPTFLITALALYSLTPYSYDPTNAKNVGMSARAVGLLLVELYLYSMTLHAFGSGWGFLLIAGAAVFAIVLTSIFALQFVVFSAPVLAIGLGSPSYLLVPLAALAIVFIMMPSYVIAYFKGQYLHKKSYCRYAARPFLLDPRPGIWRDLAWDFWRSILQGPKPGAQGSTTVRYIALNPVVVVCTGFPALVLLAWTTLTAPEGDTTTPSGLLQGMPELLWPLIACLALFIATSFRMTRFLGEPQRYIECGMAFICTISAIVLVPHPYMVAGLLLFQTLYLSAHLARILVDRRRNAARSDRTKSISDALERLASDHEGPLRILGNNLAITKELMSLERRIFYGFGLPDSFGGIPTGEVMGRYPIVSKNHVEMLILNFDIDYVVIDEELKGIDHMSGSDVRKIALERVHSDRGLELFRVTPGA